ncbi:CHAT domain-containing protein [Nocardia sp. NEAU-G5]|uniref:CHAT domain-containing protein n=2 Tax=Nocardia albiluteola TaxID=2842303 RepID=A0ABS6AXC4_9NOCA|nr:CHAT domain-containing protein [Nocardia albiluteola]MBU3065459.1 CHAT domain-containing protein [Nocardia albiluteola]
MSSGTRNERGTSIGVSNDAEHPRETAVTDSQRPTVLVRMADAGDLYVSWRWRDDITGGGVEAIPEAQVAELVARVSTALPAPSADRIEYALTAGAFADYDSEHELAQALSRTLLPHGLAAQLHDLYLRGVRPHIRLQPSPRTAQLPWELLAPDPGLRLLDIADISQLAPAGLINAPGRVPRSWVRTRDLPVVAVLDPRVPGFRADSALGSVLGRMSTHATLTERIADYLADDRMRPAVPDPVEAFRRTDQDRAWLSAALRAGASRLLYVGHVTAAAPESGRSEEARLHLACADDVPGFAAPERTHRPLSARDLILGTQTLDGAARTGPELWPIPSRVALIACESGGDLRFGETLGLLAAMINGGAELVTAGRWALPTDLAFRRFADVAADRRPLQETVCAIDAAHEQPDPIAALTEWQRERLAAWRAGRSVPDSPMLWAAFATLSA